MMHGMHGIYTVVVNAMAQCTVAGTGEATQTSPTATYDDGTIRVTIYSPPADAMLFGFAEEPIILVRDRAVYEKATSERRPQSMFVLRRSGFHRPGRTLRHRGGFRNFHKIHKMRP